jgi:hypothetical protein
LALAAFIPANELRFAISLLDTWHIVEIFDHTIRFDSFLWINDLVAIDGAFGGGSTGRTSERSCTDRPCRSLPEDRTPVDLYLILLPSAILWHTQYICHQHIKFV